MILKNKTIFINFVIISALFIIGYFSFWHGSKNAAAPSEVKINEMQSDDNKNYFDNGKSINDITESIIESSEDKKIIADPIENAKLRITKKPFGIEISPQNSPISPERFRGFHTGTDFETYDNEKDIDVLIYAICSGPLLLKKQATGYGGAVAQKCDIENEIVTVVYGHLKLSSVEKKIGDKYLAGERIGILGKGYSAETDGERKHLHLSIHKGSNVNIIGYVQNREELMEWINVELYL
jgi:hypothetical protein